MVISIRKLFTVICRISKRAEFVLISPLVVALCIDISYAQDNDDDDIHNNRTQNTISVSENSIVIKGVSIKSTTSRDGSSANISQSISIGEITSSNNNGENSIQIGTVDSGDSSGNCKQLTNKNNLSVFSKIVTNNGNIKLEEQHGGPVCVKGSNNKIHIRNGSQLGSLYVDGFNNELYVKDASSVKKINLVGEKNIIVLPKRHNIKIIGLSRNRLVTNH